MTKNFLIDKRPCDESDDNAFRINEEYARRFEYNKKREELVHLKEKYGNKTELSTDTESSTSSEEDEDGDLLTHDLDAKILKTIGKVRAKSAEIYDKDKMFFSEKDGKKMEKHYIELAKIKKSDQENPKITIKQFQREQLLNGKENFDSDSDDDQNKRGMNREGLEKDNSFDIEDEDEEIKRAFSLKENDRDDKNLSLFKIKSKTPKEEEEEEYEYKKFLLENLSKDKDVCASMNHWIQNNNSNDNKDSFASMNGDEKFLVDYILGRGWIEKKDNKSSLETSFNDMEERQKKKNQKIIDREDAERLETIELEEAAYNFRYEQPEAEKIATYAREIKESLRQMTNPSRKRQREAKKKRKEEEKIRQFEELKRLKNLKKEEIMSKLEKLEKVSGNDRISKKMESLLEEDEFDPEKHDKEMNKMFGKDFYSKKERGKDLIKDRISEEEDEENFISSGELIANKETLSKAKKVLNDYFLASSNSTSNSNAPNLKKYLDEYYQLDYEEKIGDLKCRFKYTKLNPMSFGLELDDVLEADDTDLNSHVSIKKLAPYRSLDSQEKDMMKYGNKRRVFLLKKKIKENNKAIK